jgi:hypothetical protein
VNTEMIRPVIDRLLMGTDKIYEMDKGWII